MTDFELFKSLIKIKNIEITEREARTPYIDIFYSPLNTMSAKIIENINKLNNYIKINIYPDNTYPIISGGKTIIYFNGFNKKFLDPDFISLLRSILLNEDYIEIEYKRLRRADNNRHVLWLNYKLYSLGYIERHKILHCFTEATYKAVLKFQKHNGLIEDGIVERITFEMLKTKF